MPLVIMVLALAAAMPQPDRAERTREAERLVAASEQEISLGDYSAAMRHARDASARFAEAGDQRNQARALNRLGQAALYAGEYGPAAASFQQAAGLSASVGDTAGQAEQLGNLGNVHFFVGRYADAARTYDEALALVDGAHGAPWTDRRRRILLVNKATLNQRLGHDQDALAIYLALEGAELPPDEQAQLLVNRGVLYRRLGDPVKALSTYDEARRLFARGRHVDGELGVMKNRGIVLALDLEQLETAERAFSEVVLSAGRAGNRRELLHAHLYRGETRLRAGRLELAHDDFVTALPLAKELKTPEEEWKALFGLGRTETNPERRKEQLAAAVSVIEQIRERIGVPSLRSDYFNDKIEVFDALIRTRLGAAPVDEVFGLVERSHSRAWRDRLGLSRPVELSSIQRVLPPGVLLLDYWSSPRGSALVAATATRAATMDVTVSDTRVTSFVDNLASGENPEWRASAKVFGAEILPPSDWFEGVHHVIVVPAGALALVPFELLTVGESLLIQRAAVTYTPTAATLLLPPSSRSRWAPPWSFQLEAYGDPVPAADAGGGDTQTGAGLPSSAAEVRAIASELSGTADLHLGADNRKAYLSNPGERPAILHIASHAFADGTALERSRILFSPAGGDGSKADVLFLREAYDLPLANVELAVLSACDTERGHLVRGEGVQSFSRAFLAAGARSTVTTLWRVADKPTESFMRIFYHHLQRGAPRAEALRHAKLAFLESGSRAAHPHYWAAFLLAGDGLTAVPRALTWTWLLMGAALLVIVVSAGPWILRGRARGREARTA